MMSGAHSKSDPLDLVMDVELKAKRTLGAGSPDYSMFLRILAEEDPRLLPEDMRLKLGQAFKALGSDGIYADLYFSAKRSGDLARQDDSVRLVEHRVELPEDRTLETVAAAESLDVEDLFAGTDSMDWTQDAAQHSNTIRCS
jgi:hypothetical protein